MWTSGFKTSFGVMLGKNCFCVKGLAFVAAPSEFLLRSHVVEIFNIFIMTHGKQFLWDCALQSSKNSQIVTCAIVCAKQGVSSWTAIHGTLTGARAGGALEDYGQEPIWLHVAAIAAWVSTGSLTTYGQLDQVNSICGRFAPNCGGKTALLPLLEFLGVDKSELSKAGATILETATDLMEEDEKDVDTDAPGSDNSDGPDE